MESILKTGLKEILDGNFKDNGFLDCDKLLVGSEKLTEFYKSYIRVENEWEFNDETFQSLLLNAPDREAFKDYKVDWSIDDVKPFFEEFNVKRFWFKNTNNELNPYSKIPIKSNEVIAFQDGINTIFYTGEFLEGGQMFKEVKEQDTTAEQGDFFDDFLKPQPTNQSENKDKSYFNDFIYAYFPKKLFLSPYSRNFYILTQGKNSLRNREQPIIRIYFNLKPSRVNYVNIKEYLAYIEGFKSKVNGFVKEIENHLDSRNIPFQTKLPSSLENFNRSDTLVLYLSQNHYFYLYEFINSLVHSDEYKNIFGKKLPLFVKQLYSAIKGVGMSEDSLNPQGDSFGSSRCKLIYTTIEKLAIEDNKKDSLSIEEIIEELKTQGYNEDEFFRNPFTNYSYKIQLLEPVHGLNVELNPLNTRYYLYVYGRVALNYALELVEKAIWLNSEEITWITYYKAENIEDKDGYYRLVDKNEGELIYWYLYQIFKFGWMRKYFPKHLIEIIRNKVSETDIPLNLDTIKLKFSEAKTNYIDIWDDAQALINQNNGLLGFFSHLGQSVVTGARSIADEGEEYWETIFSVPEQSVISKIYELQKGTFGENKEIIKNARKIYYQYIKPLYPIPNKYGNYEFCPTEKGKLQIAMVMLFIYNPNLFDDES
jgi:HopA1 effector protein family